MHSDDACLVFQNEVCDVVIDSKARAMTCFSL